MPTGPQMAFRKINWQSFQANDRLEAIGKYSMAIFGGLRQGTWISLCECATRAIGISMAANWPEVNQLFSRKLFKFPNMVFGRVLIVRLSKNPKPSHTHMQCIVETVDCLKTHTEKRCKHRMDRG